MLTFNSTKLVETHRKLTFIVVALLLEPLGIQYLHEPDQSDEEFNYVYVTGITMLTVFMASFVLFNKDRWKKSKS